MVKKLIYKFDDRLEFCNDLSKLQINDQDYNPEKSVSEPFPSDHTLFKFANLAYTDFKKYNTCDDFAIPEGWEFLTSARSTASGYYGAAFWNPELCQVVVANKGTDDRLSLWRDLLIFLDKKPAQAQSASTFIHKLGKVLKEKFENEYYQLSITGHSLGGWLAQIQTFTIKYLTVENENFVRDDNYLNNVHAHAVVFESPGCREGLRQLTEENRPGPYGDYKSLDVTTYLSKKNFINRGKEHIGLLYRMDVDGHTRRHIKSWFERTNPSKKILIDFSTGILPAAFGKDSSSIVERDYSNKEHSLNVFNSKELKYLKRWVEIKEISELQKFKLHNEIPYYYNIDERKHVIGAEDQESLMKTIGHIKHSKCDYESLEQIFQVVISQHINDFRTFFQNTKKLFQSNFVEFTNFYFEDVYNLKSRFNESSAVFLSVDMEINNAQFLEMSLIRNILSSYDKQNELKKYEYLSLAYFPTEVEFFGKIINGFKLFIIDATSAKNGQIETIKEYLNNNGINVIFIISKVSSSEFTHTEGVADKIKFKNLSQTAQRKIFQTTFELFGKAVRLEDEVKFPQSSQDHELMEQLLKPEFLWKLLINSENNNSVDFTARKVYDTGMQQECSTIIENIDCFQNHMETLEQSCQFVVIESDGSFTLPPNLIEEQQMLDYSTDKIIYWVTIKGKLVYVDKIYNRKYYLTRGILYNKTMDIRFLKDGLLKSHKFIFVNIDGSTIDGDLFESTDQVESTLDDAMKQFNATTNENIHIFKIETKKIVWWKSKGEIRPLRSYLDTPKSIDEEQLIEKISEEKVVIISGEPGMGKSTTTAKIHFELQKESRLVLLISLSTCSPHLEKLVNSVLTDGLVIEFLLDASGISSSNFHEALHIHALHSKKLPLYVLFDGFNEIYNKNHVDAFLDLAKYLIHDTEAKILITTRLGSKELLENHLSVFGSSFQKLGDDKLTNFCCTFWYDQLILTQPLHKDDIQIYAEELLNVVNSKLKGEVVDFVGIPLQMKIAAQIFTPNLLEKKIKNQFSFQNVLQLYQKYMKCRYDKYFQQHLKNGEDRKTLKSWLSSEITTKCSELAIWHYFDYISINLTDEDYEELSAVGIVQCEYNNFSFTHNTVIDYYAAEWLTRWLKVQWRYGMKSNDSQLEKDLITKIFFESEYTMLRYFLNGLLEINDIIDVERPFEKISDWWSNNPKMFKNNESALHIATREQLDYIIEKILLPVFDRMDTKVKFFAKHNDKEETVLIVAIRNKSKTILNRFLELINTWPEEDIKELLLATLFHTFEEKDDHKRIKELINYIHKFSKLVKVLRTIEIDVNNKTRFRNFITSGDVEEFKSIMKNSRSSKLYLQLITKVEKQTLAHLAAIHGQPVIINELNELNCDLNVEDYHGMTPVARAAQKGYLNVISTLIDKGANYDIYDHSKVSPFMHASKRGYLGTLKIMIEKKNDRSDKENLLLHKDKYGMTAITYATMNEHIKVVQYLAETAFEYFGDEALEKIIDLKDANDMTPLLYAVKKRTKLTLDEHLKLVKYLVDKGADVNACTEWIKMTPLLRSIQCKYWNIVDYLIKKGANANIKSRDGIPLLKLIWDDKPKLANLMIERGADPSVLSDEQRESLNT